MTFHFRAPHGQVAGEPDALGDNQRPGDEASGSASAAESRDDTEVQPVEEPQGQGTGGPALDAFALLADVLISLLFVGVIAWGLCHLPGQTAPDGGAAGIQNTDNERLPGEISSRDD